MKFPTALLLPLLPSFSAASLASRPKPESATTTVTLRIAPAPPVLPNPHLLPPSTHATLSTLGRAHSAPLSVANTFVFANVTPGSYLVDVHCRSHAFVPLRLDVLRPDAAADDDGHDGGAEGKVKIKAWETFRGNDWANKGEGLTVLDGGVVDLRVAGEKGYFMERSQFSVLSILKNPIILLSLVSMALFLGMPKLVENMDPETRAEWEERQKENPMNALMGAASGQNANPMGNFDMAAFLAGSSSSSNKAEESNGGKGKGESRKKR